MGRKIKTKFGTCNCCGLRVPKHNMRVVRGIKYISKVDNKPYPVDVCLICYRMSDEHHKEEYIKEWGIKWL